MSCRNILNILILSLVLLIVLAGALKPNHQRVYLAGQDSNTLWNRTVKLHLRDPLWEKRDIEDAGAFLMIPLQAAFMLNNEEWQRDFSEHFARFPQVPPTPEIEKEIPRLSRQNYLYLASRFCVLAKKANRSNLIPPGLPSFLLSETERIWREPAWQWDRAAFPNMRERILWKLNNKTVTQSYYRALTDEELFQFAMAANLQAYGFSSTTLTEILDLAFTALKQESVFQDGWLLQPGVWRDHPAYVNAGCETRVKPCPVEGIATDTSHSHRWPVWLMSLEEARPQERAFTQKIRERLIRQFVGKVLVAPSYAFPAPRTKNFLDGHNGYFRVWGPYELSGSFLIGYWSLLGAPQIQAAYRQIIFPLPEVVLKTYAVNSGRNGHPLLNDRFTNGYAELIVKLAQELPVAPIPGVYALPLRLNNAQLHAAGSLVRAYTPIIGEVKVNGKPARVVSSAPGLIDFEVPNVPSGNASVVISKPGTSLTLPAVIRNTNPALWASNGTNYGEALAQDADTFFVYSKAYPAGSNARVVLYATGIRALSQMVVKARDEHGVIYTLPVEYSSAQISLPGLDQLIVRLPGLTGIITIWIEGAEDSQVTLSVN